MRYWLHVSVWRFSTSNKLRDTFCDFSVSHWYPLSPPCDSVKPSCLFESHLQNNDTKSSIFLQKDEKTQWNYYYITLYQETLFVWTIFCVCSQVSHRQSTIWGYWSGLRLWLAHWHVWLVRNNMFDLRLCSDTL